MSAEQHAPNKRQRELLDKHLELVIEENKVTNLTESLIGSLLRFFTLRIRSLAFLK